jgi:hypothetical protein
MLIFLCIFALFLPIQLRFSMLVTAVKPLEKLKKIATGAYFHPSYPIPDILPLIPSLPFPATGGCIPGATGV